MAQEDASSGGGLVFHERFNTKRAGDVIIQAGDEQALCFYFRLSLLSELSSFFASLPPPSSTDLRDGTPLIPLADAPSNGLYVFLSAIETSTSAVPFSRPFADLSSDPEQLLAAALIGRKFDCPIVFRILAESLSGGGSGMPFRSPESPYAEFVIWSLGGVTSQLHQAAMKTIEPRAEYIVDVEASITGPAKLYSDHWYKLLEFHLRYFRGPDSLRDTLKVLASSLLLPFIAHQNPQAPVCIELPEEASLSRRIYQRLAGARTTAEILAIRKDNYGLQCGTCLMEAIGRYQVCMDRFVDDAGFGVFSDC